MCFCNRFNQKDKQRALSMYTKNKTVDNFPVKFSAKSYFSSPFLDVIFVFVFEKFITFELFEFFAL